MSSDKYNSSHQRFISQLSHWGSFHKLNDASACHSNSAEYNFLRDLQTGIQRQIQIQTQTQIQVQCHSNTADYNFLSASMTFQTNYTVCFFCTLFPGEKVVLKGEASLKTSQGCETALTSQYQTLFLVFLFCLYFFLSFCPFVF